MYKLILLCVLLILSCSSNLHKERELNSLKNDRYRILIEKSLKDESVIQFAKDLYLGRVKISDNAVSLSLLDSLNSNFTTRGFYFLVVTKSLKLSDGSFGESLGITCKSFVENNTIEFLSYFKENKDLLSDLDFKNWAIKVYGEIKIDSEGLEQKAILDLKEKMVSNSKDLTLNEIKKVEEFISFMK